ncbi:hypothetical protein ACFQL1_19305 [Halomicroarcula sp. GCM10025709]|uniref:hypothetical protein n=1 Tax=Haloarcula TaxID=2237 RepID=UPI0024C321D1|nr:hypothetical protein [Halomicroarcula sp. YJ-61-S]
MADPDSLRAETHTGENRCWPCTIVNLALLGVLTLFLAVRKRRLVAAGVATLGVGVIYLRGYLVPYTPAFAPRLVAASPLPDEWFHDDYGTPEYAESEDTTDDSADEQSVDPEDDTSLADGVDLDGETVMRELAEAGVLDADGEMLFLADDIESEWHERMDDLSTLPLDSLAAEVGETFPHVEHAEGLHTDGRDWVVVGEENGSLVAKPVVVAELAAYRALSASVDDQQVRTAAAETFRMFLEDCPACGTALAESTEVGCCGGYTNPRESPDETLVCPSCKQRVYRFPTE